MIRGALLPHSGDFARAQIDFEVLHEASVALQAQHVQVLAHLREVTPQIGVLPTVKVENFKQARFYKFQILRGESLRSLILFFQLWFGFHDNLIKLNFLSLIRPLDLIKVNEHYTAAGLEKVFNLCKHKLS